ncbi:H(+)/Cl(-) exchange transporter ClcA [Legionella spiritensis]|uniref:Voltage-gated chloride channel protein (ClC-type) n=1 Tax=Legionella spiritensis TaxID=452 RepID=A0A0W0Z6Q2_LEGSP|nr:H(+)/Cl(-) exchange transporter ClcA [Legionella spiritensis]KTD64800.1 voltage-gated chloride channel protein (ClC-type) [Legionella spiritensis]SNV40031.1 chloride channel protein, CIC family [Legionella spiritensis]VEG90441.1 chloride channel protein, CIC family [Legionella spiritensis]
MANKILKIYGISILLGILTGIVGSYFRVAIKLLDHGLLLVFGWATAHGVDKVLPSVFFSTILAFIAWWMVKKFAPEASGSGVQEIEGVLLHERGIFWRRLIPVKFIAGVAAISAKMVLGREGPTIQMGGNLGEMLGEMMRVQRERRNTLIAAGAAAGLATAFNAPLAGVLFVIEEMRNEFNFTFTNFKMVAIACVMATITTHLIIGTAPAIAMSVFEMPGSKALWLFFILGIIIGFAGLFFNVFLMKTLYLKDKLSNRGQALYVSGAGALVGALFCYYPEVVGGGYEIIHEALTMSPTMRVLLILTVIRFFTTMLCYSTSVPGGIFAPMLALGTLLGLAVYQGLAWILPDAEIYPGMFAVAGMGALFSAAVRAPVTGIVLVVEMTQNYSLILPMMVSCLTSTTIVQLAKNPPIYTQLLKRTLKMQDANELRSSEC